MSGPHPPSEPLLAVRDLAIDFDIAGGGRVRAVDGVSFSVHAGRTHALVGESGCGKTVTALALMGLIEAPGRVSAGSVRFDGNELLDLDAAGWRRLRGASIGMIFQEPTTALNPIMPVGEQIVEAIRLHRSMSRRAARAESVEALREVGIRDPDRTARAFAHELSGGMCQRAMIAIALAGRPRLLLADEPTTALDVTVQAQILDLLDEVRRRRRMSAVLITHDLGIVARTADVVSVMYAGRVVEHARVRDLFERPLHPYTRGLLGSVPRIGARCERLHTVAETIDDPGIFRSMPGHAFGVEPWWPTRRPDAELASADEEIALLEAEPGHWVACWRTPWVVQHPSRAPDADADDGISRAPRRPPRRDPGP